MTTLLVFVFAAIISAINYYSFRDTFRKNAIKAGAAIWAINPITGKKTFKFLKNQNNEILSHLNEKDTPYNMVVSIEYVKKNYTR